MPGFIASYTKTPKPVFRINTGPLVRLRAYPAPHRPHGIFDLFTYSPGGIVKPKALDPGTYEREDPDPNPNTLGTKRRLNETEYMESPSAR
ncbi:uncharacterized protein BDV17DRAFT_292579 [Aspergillus undulatus]|uniref:uncharacterized protein n=1 Tax=Aspergillus undulatus TaxID=1810928 RepID=UPI003CCDF3D8